MSNSNVNVTNFKINPVSQKVASIDLNVDVEDNLTVNGKTASGIDLSEIPYIWVVDHRVLGLIAYLADSSSAGTVTKVFNSNEEISDWYIIDDSCGAKTLYIGDLKADYKFKIAD